MEKKSPIIFVCVKVVWSALVSQMSGKLNGSKIYTGRTGSIISNRVKPKNKNSATQISSRALIRYFAAAWKSLSQTLITEWNSQGAATQHKDKLGKTHTMSGFNLWITENCRLNFIIPNSAALTDPPGPTEPLIYGNTSIKSAVGGATPALTCDIPQVGTNDMLVVYASPSISTGKTFVKGKYLPIIRQAVHAAQPALDILTAYKSVFGDPVTGKQIFIKSEYFSIQGSKVNKYVAGAPTSLKVL